MILTEQIILLNHRQSMCFCRARCEGCVLKADQVKTGHEAPLWHRWPEYCGTQILGCSEKVLPSDFDLCKTKRKSFCSFVYPCACDTNIICLRATTLGPLENPRRHCVSLSPCAQLPSPPPVHHAPDRTAAGG